MPTLTTAVSVLMAAACIAAPGGQTSQSATSPSPLRGTTEKQLRDTGRAASEAANSLRTAVLGAERLTRANVKVYTLTDRATQQTRRLNGGIEDPRARALTEMYLDSLSRELGTTSPSSSSVPPVRNLLFTQKDAANVRFVHPLLTGQTRVEISPVLKAAAGSSPSKRLHKP